MPMRTHHVVVSEKERQLIVQALTLLGSSKYEALTDTSRQTVLNLIRTFGTLDKGYDPKVS